MRPARVWPLSILPPVVGSVVEETSVSSIDKNRTPKETRIFNGQKYIRETALQPDYAFVHAQIGDREGNLRYAKDSQKLQSGHGNGRQNHYC